jgi:hypothetical protein
VLADLLAIMLFRISTRPRQRVRLSSLAYAFGEADNTMVPQIARPATRLLSFREFIRPPPCLLGFGFQIENWQREVALRNPEEMLYVNACNYNFSSERTLQALP